MRFDLTDLRLFLHVAEAASITHGAGRANLALASASARVRGMEEALGVALLERGRRGVRPTPAGQALIHHARVVLQQLERMRGELGEHARGLKGHVRLLCNTAALTEFLPEALATYLTAHPNIDIDLEERLSYEIVQAVAEGLAEIGIVADAVDLAGLETFTFRLDRLVLVVPRGHRLAARRRLAFREVVDYEFVGLSPGSALQEYLGQHAAHAGHPLRLRVRLRGFEAVCRMVERGVGLGVVPETAARRCRRSMAIRAVRLTDPWALRNLTICVRRFDALPVHARRLVEHLKSGSHAAPRA
ncbi:MAG: LysR family transcriptional regulator [Proteobacteria bacterium]|nr:LysR family transcriptional regulator [Pseudomonadota bacterium]